MNLNDIDFDSLKPQSEDDAERLAHLYETFLEMQRMHPGAEFKAGPRFVELIERSR